MFWNNLHAGLVRIFLHWSTHLVLELGHAFLLYCSSNYYIEVIPDVIHCPNKDARSRSDRLQLGTTHIQSFTQTRQMSVVMGMTRFWAAVSECSAYSGHSSHRHASSGFVSVQTHQTAQSWHDLIRTSVFLFTLIVLFSEEFLLHSSSWFYWGVSLTLLELVLVRSFSYTPLLVRMSFSYIPDAIFGEEFLLHSSSWF